MYNLLEQMLPPEVAVKVMMYTQHPIAEAMTPLIAKHREKMAMWRDFCKRRQRPDSSKNDGFALNFFLERKFRMGREAGKNSKEVASENRHLLKLYY